LFSFVCLSRTPASALVSGRAHSRFGMNWPGDRYDLAGDDIMRRAGHFFFLILVSFSSGLASDESEDVRIDHVGIRGHHAVGEARVNFERTMLEQLGLQH
jgi:hypothetical protein